MNYIYEYHPVKAGRKIKICDVCGKTINKGEPSITITCFHGEFYNVDVCTDECKEKFYEDFDKEDNDEEDE